MPRTPRFVAVTVSLSLASVLGCATGTSIDDLAPPEPAGAEREPTGAVLPSPSRGDGEDTAAGADAGAAAPGTGSCAAATSCDAPTDLGEIAGDVGSEGRSQQGVGSHWFTVLVREDSTSSTPVRLRAELTSPSGSNYDLFVLTNPYSTTGTECSNVRASSTTANATEAASLELKYYSGIDDEQRVTIEVRHVSGPCDPSAKWTLELTGNAP